jgi:hypothetical protein
VILRQQLSISLITSEERLPKDIANALETREEVNMTDFMPVLQQSVEQDPTKAAIENNQYEILYGVEISKYVERSTLYEGNKDKDFALLFAQCNKALQNKICHVGTVKLT